MSAIRHFHAEPAQVGIEGCLDRLRISVGACGCYPDFFSVLACRASASAT